MWSVPPLPGPYVAVTGNCRKVNVSETSDNVALNPRGCVTALNVEYVFAYIQTCFPFQKLYVFLFQDILVLTRPVTRNERQAYQVYRQPIPVQELLLEDLQDGDVKMGGSFRGAFGNSDKGTDQTNSSAWESVGEERWRLGIDPWGSFRTADTWSVLTSTFRLLLLGFAVLYLVAMNFAAGAQMRKKKSISTWLCWIGGFSLGFFGGVLKAFREAEQGSPGRLSSNGISKYWARNWSAFSYVYLQLKISSEFVSKIPPRASPTRCRPTMSSTSNSGLIVSEPPSLPSSGLLPQQSWRSCRSWAKRQRRTTPPLPTSKPRRGSLPCLA